MSRYYVNLNRHEIYGMAILEAMYYECPVIAFHAPGPDFLLDNGRCGYLCGSDEEMLSALSDAVLADFGSPVSESGISTVCDSSSSENGISTDSGSSEAESAHTIADAARARVLSSFLWERCLPELGDINVSQ